MKLLKVIIVFCLISSANAFSRDRDITIESKDLNSVGQKVVSTVSKDASFEPFKDLGCKLVGKKIPLTSSSTVTYFITTSNACGWGAAVGPIWIVDESREKVILSTGGYSIEVRQHAKNGFHDIDVNSEISGNPQSTSYFFKEGKYAPLKTHDGSVRH
ncbi:hypothetical protein KDW49_13605 [Burkholderia dolosa]|uniref:hypothetical protein n=1 Tax=Burkholderia dolosa TaxID=152500 RepID=UPI001B98B60D|nr:hypothetical protein [Burkholderia dolosa]MBR8301740.1 hypothetical protein [Burkholderia dolosa]MBR8316027.1 hypothetical protein [Burkholderia dolosa]